MNNKYYVYLHIKLDNGEPFYVGKGTGYRCKKQSNRGDFWNNVVKKHGFDIILLEENLTEEKSFELETYWINRIGRRDLGLGTLINLTNGGDGASGCVQSEESKLKKSISLKGRKNGPHSAERLKNMSKPRSEQAKINIRNGILKRFRNKEVGLG